MAVDIRIGSRDAKVKLLETDGNKATIEVDGNAYSVDLAMVEEGVYSILHEGKSYNIELIPGNGPKNYFVNTYSASHEIEIIDAQSRYQKSRNSSSVGDSDRLISAPMPGKVVRIPVKKGQNVSKGDTLIVISAMKMENDYQSPIDGVVKSILVNEGESVSNNQPLIEIE